jgi:hypothetical protein
MDNFEEFLFEKMQKDGLWKNFYVEDVYIYITKVRCRKDDKDLGSFIMIREDEFNSIQQDADSFNKLVAAGVDNWEGYESAMEDE